MKKFFSIILISICLSTQLIGCEKKDSKNINETENSDETIKIMENVYMDYITDIYWDSSKYIGKNLEIEGMFTLEKDEDNNEYYYVYRWASTEDNSKEECNHEECNHDESNHEECNHDENNLEGQRCGLEFSYDKKINLKENDWIKVKGKLKEKNGNLVLEADSVEVMKDRGLEKVEFFY